MNIRDERLRKVNNRLSNILFPLNIDNYWNKGIRFF